MTKVYLKKGREKSLARRHQWVFDGAIEKVEGSAKSGDVVLVCSAKKEPLALGLFSPVSQIRIRIISFNPKDTIDNEFFKNRIKQAIDARRTLLEKYPETGCRLINAESDWLGGLIVDKYNEFLSVQISSAGMEKQKEMIVEILQEIIEPRGIYERSDVSSRKKEGLSPFKGLLAGEEPNDRECIDEGLYKFYVDIKNGQKTGFFLDQRDNRAAVSRYSKDRNVLNCFAYSGGFTVPALAGGAKHVESVDISGSALKFCKENIKLNGFDESKNECVEADVFKYLRTLRDSRKSYDMIILDPPKFAESRSQIEKASRGYKDINLLAMKLLNPGGILATFSCSGHISTQLFQSIVASAAADAKKDAQIIEHLFQSSDHPIALDYPEGTYLKGLICRVL